MSQGLCPSCGAVANLTAEQNQINCTYCGSVVSRQEAEAQLNEVKTSKFAGTLMIAETAQEGGSYEEALNYYNKVIEQEPSFADAWLNKGICMVSTSKIGNLKIPEAISSWKAAIKFAKNPEAMKKRVALEINNVVARFYPRLEQHYLEFHSLSDALSEHYDRFVLLESALSLALTLNPANATVAKNGIDLCDEFVASIKSAAGDDYSSAFSSVLDKDSDGAIEKVASASRKKNTAEKIEASLLTIKLKYMKALQAINGPESGRQEPVVQDMQAKIDALESAANENDAKEKQKKKLDRVENEARKTFLGKITSFSLLGFFVGWFGMSIVWNVVMFNLLGLVLSKEQQDDNTGLCLLLSFGIPTGCWFYLRTTIRKRILAKRTAS